MKDLLITRLNVGPSEIGVVGFKLYPAGYAFKLRNLVDDLRLWDTTEVYIATNYELVFRSRDTFINAFEVVRVTDDEARILESIFKGDFGENEILEAIIQGYAEDNLDEDQLSDFNNLLEVGSWKIAAEYLGSIHDQTNDDEDEDDENPFVDSEPVWMD